MPDKIQKLARKADQLIASNKLPEAIDVYRKICKIADSNPQAWLALGSLQAKIGRYAPAEDAFRKAISLGDRSRMTVEYLASVQEAQDKLDDTLDTLTGLNVENDPAIDLRIGIVLGKKKKFAEAIDYLKKSLNSKENAHVHHCLASAYEHLDDIDASRTHYERSLELTPSAQVWNNYGALLQKYGEFDKAIDAYTRSIDLDSNYAVSQYNIGSINYALGHYNEASIYFDRAITLDPNYVEAYCGKGRTLRSMGQSQKALDYYDQALSIDPDNTEAYSNKARALIAVARHDEALELYERAHETDPDNFEVECAIASLLERKGRFDDARKIIDRVMAIEPDNKYVTLAYGAISRKFDERGKAIAALKRAASKKNLSPTDRSDLHYMLGKLYDDLKEYDEAFYHFEQANELLPYDFNMDIYSSTVEAMKTAFSEERLREHPRNPESSTRPIFIVGMPRSGTTLVEQILSSHPDVFGAGELPFMSELVAGLSERISSDEQFPLNLHLITPGIERDMAQEFIEKATRLEPDCIRFTDKMPHNFRLIGLIELLFPDAKVIHCNRNPIDTCLSIYVNSFIMTHPYATNLSNAGLYYTHFYREMMKHWKQVCSIDILDIHYEKLVDDQERYTRELIGFCDLEWNDACLNFHESERNVGTISYDQVRQPMYKKSRERWRNYEKHLGPLIEHFEKYPVDD